MKHTLKVFNPRTIGNFLYRLTEPKDFDEVVELTVKAFQHNEPLCQAIHVDTQEFIDYCYGFKEQLLSNPLSIVAVDRVKNIIVGSRLCGDYNEEGFEHPETKQGNFNDILILFSDIRETLLNKGKVTREQGKVYHLFMGAIHEDYAGQGIIKTISELNQELALIKGFEYALSEATSAQTQHIYTTQGYDCIHFLPYSQLPQIMPNVKIDQAKLISQFKPPYEPGLRIMMKKLNDKGTLKNQLIGNIEYRVMESKDFDQVSELTANAFSKYEALCSAAHVPIQDVRALINGIKDQLLEQPMSLVAVDTKKNLIVGSKICNDYNEHTNFPDGLSKEIQAFGEFYDNIRQQLITGGMIPKEKVYHMFMGSIHPDYRNLGIIRQLCVLNQELAWNLGFDYVISESTSGILQHIYNSSKFECVYMLPYSQIQNAIPNVVFDYNKLTASFKGDIEAGIRIMVKKLTNSQYS